MANIPYVSGCIVLVRSYDFHWWFLIKGHTVRIIDNVDDIHLLQVDNCTVGIDLTTADILVTWDTGMADLSEDPLTLGALTTPSEFVLRTAKEIREFLQG